MRLAQLQQRADELLTEQLCVLPGSRFDRSPLGATEARTRTGASIVAVLRGVTTHPSPAPDFVLRGGDLGRLGNRETLAIVIAVVTVGVEIVLATRFGTSVTRLVGTEDNEPLLLVAGIADELKVSAAVGAFLVGIAVSGSVAENAVSLLGPLRDLFAAVFFVTFGLSTAAIQKVPDRLPAEPRG